MIRERMLSRANRGSEDRSRARMNERGAVDINQVDQALYRPDLGFKVTGAGYDEYKRGEGLFGKAYDEIIGSNNTALAANQGILGQISQSQSAINSLANTPIEQMYAEVKKGFIPVYIGTTKEQSSPNVFYVPREVANKMAAGGTGLTANYFEVPPGQITARSQWTTNPGTDQEVAGIQDPARQNFLVVSPYVGGKGVPDGKYIAEVEQSILGLEQSVQSEFYTQLAPKIEQAKNQWGELEAKKGEVQSYIDASNKTIQETEQQKQLRDTTKAQYKQDYLESTSKRQALFRPWA